MIIENCKKTDLVFLFFAARTVFPDMLTITGTKKLYEQNSFVEICPTAQVPVEIHVEKESFDTFEIKTNNLCFTILMSVTGKN